MIINKIIFIFNEIIIFKTALKDSEIQVIEQYLSVKWGVALKGL